MKAHERACGFRDGMRFAVTWLHERANEMNDPWAKAVLNTAAFNLGVEGKAGTIEAKAKLLEVSLARAAANGELPISLAKMRQPEEREKNARASALLDRLYDGDGNEQTPPVTGKE